MKELYESKFVNGDILQSSPQQQMAVKQGCFKDGLFARRHWIYTENYHYTTDGVIIIITTVNGTARSQIINGITAAYTIKILQSETNLQRNLNFNIMFRGKITQGCGRDKKHLSMLAKSIRKIPNIIMNRQILIQSRVLPQFSMNNQYCISCVKRIFWHKLPYFKSKCDLCAYYICQNCSHIKVLFNQTRFESVTICTRCLIRLKYCDYSSIGEQSLASRNIVPDAIDYNAGSNIFDYMIEHRDPSIDRLIKMMLKSDTIDIDALHTYLTDHPLLEDCDISTASHATRTYAIDMPQSLLELDRIVMPIPPNEVERLKAARRVHPERLMRNEDLNRLCQIANAEFKNISTLISIIDEVQLCVVASDDPQYIQYYDKRDSVCQHMIIDGKPLLVINPEADMKFYNLPSIRALDIKFYFSVPIFSSDNYIVGSFCTIDSSVKPISVSQYSIMRKLSQLISTIIEEQAQM